MVEETIAYHRRRAEQEVLLAENATDCSVVHAHYELSCLHFDIAERLELGRGGTGNGPFLLKQCQSGAEPSLLDL